MKKFKGYKLLLRLKQILLPNIPNIRLRLSLKGKSLNQTMCAELQQALKLEQDLTETKLQITPKYYHYKWERKVKDTKRFKRALAKYQESHPNTDIISEDIRPFKPMIPYIGYIASIAGAFIGFIMFIT